MERDRVTAARPAADRTGAATAHFVAFRVAGHTYGVALEHVERVLYMVAVTPVPEPAPCVMGAIDLHGQVVPVLNARERLGHPSRCPGVDDRLLVVRTDGGRFAVVVDETLQVIGARPEELQPSHATVQNKQLLQAILRSDGQMVLVLDPSQLVPAVP